MLVSLARRVNDSNFVRMEAPLPARRAGTSARLAGVLQYRSEKDVAAPDTFVPSSRTFPIPVRFKLRNN